jgi:membrane protease subunit (stomatin/prohibitin family)
MSVVRDEVNSLLDRLPEDASIEDVQYHLYVIEKVRNGLEAAQSEGSITQEQAEERLGKWLIQ